MRNVGDEATHRSRIFVSYCIADEVAAGGLVAALRSQGYNVWRDVEGVRFHGEAAAAVLEALQESILVLLLCSQRSLSRPWVKAEIHYARRIAASIIGVRLEPCAIPAWAATPRRVDLFSCDSPRLTETKAFARLTVLLDTQLRARQLV